MSKITKEDVEHVLAFITIGGFLMALLWNILVVNHTKDVERDKFYATHCKQVEQHTLSNRFECIK